MLYYLLYKFGCKETSSLEDTTEIVTFWLYKPLLWPRHWTQWTNFSAWHSGLWCCITIPGLVTKCSLVQKISSKHSLTFWTFAVALNLNAVIPFFHTTLQLIMLYYQTKFGCKQTSSLEERVKIVALWWALAVTLTLKIVNQFFRMTHRFMIRHHHIKFG